MPADHTHRLAALTSTFAADLVRIAREEGYAAGLASGLERGRRQAQTEVDGLTYERGVADERGRAEGLVARHFADAPTDADEILRAIRSGEPAP